MAQRVEYDQFEQMVAGQSDERESVRREDPSERVEGGESEKARKRVGGMERELEREKEGERENERDLNPERSTRERGESE